MSLPQRFQQIVEKVLADPAYALLISRDHPKVILRPVMPIPGGHYYPPLPPPQTQTHSDEKDVKYMVNVNLNRGTRIARRIERLRTETRLNTQQLRFNLVNRLSELFKFAFDMARSRNIDLGRGRNG